jgi:hypothetical protein
MKDDLIGKFAVNEQNALGYVVGKEILGDQVVYFGIPVTGSRIWLLIKPITVFDSKIDPTALMEIAMQVSPPKPISAKMEDKSQSSDISITKIMGCDLGATPFISFNMPPIDKLLKMPESDDFEIDNDDNSGDHKNEDTKN